jgi:hypothetical protein
MDVTEGDGVMELNKRNVRSRYRRSREVGVEAVGVVRWS